MIERAAFAKKTSNCMRCVQVYRYVEHRSCACVIRIEKVLHSAQRLFDSKSKLRTTVVHVCYCWNSRRHQAAAPPSSMQVYSDILLPFRATFYSVMLVVCVLVCVMLARLLYLHCKRKTRFFFRIFYSNVCSLHNFQSVEYLVKRSWTNSRYESQRHFDQLVLTMTETKTKNENTNDGNQKGKYIQNYVE